jgi:hypothetical protein
MDETSVGSIGNGTAQNAAGAAWGQSSATTVLSVWFESSTVQRSNVAKTNIDAGTATMPTVNT